MSDEHKKQRIEEGEEEENVYSDEGAEELLDDDEISPEEEGFMKGEREASGG